jgi:hypothetical protein
VTEQEAGWLIAELRAAYPRSQFPAESIHVYVAYLLDLNYEVTHRAIKEIISSSDFMPSIAQIRTLVFDRELGLPSPDAAWELVSRRWGQSRLVGGDNLIVIPEEVKRALDAAGIDPYRFWTSDDRQWLRKMFLECYAEIRNRILRTENLGLARSALDRAELHGATEAQAVRALEEATGSEF